MYMNVPKTIEKVCQFFVNVFQKNIWGGRKRKCHFLNNRTKTDHFNLLKSKQILKICSFTTSYKLQKHKSRINVLITKNLRVTSYEFGLYCTCYENTARCKL